MKYEVPVIAAFPYGSIALTTFIEADSEQQAREDAVAYWKSLKAFERARLVAA